LCERKSALEGKIGWNAIYRLDKDIGNLPPQSENLCTPNRSRRSMCLLSACLGTEYKEVPGECSPVQWRQGQRYVLFRVIVQVIDYYSQQHNYT